MWVINPEVNECLEENHNCSENARCEKVPGGYICTCHTGYEGNGEICTSTLTFSPFLLWSRLWHGGHLPGGNSKSYRYKAVNNLGIQYFLNIARDPVCWPQYISCITSICSACMSLNAVSSGVIISASILAGFMVVMTLLIIIILGSIKLLKQKKRFVWKKPR